MNRLSKEGVELDSITGFCPKCNRYPNIHVISSSPDPQLDFMSRITPSS